MRYFTLLQKARTLPERTEFLKLESEGGFLADTDNFDAGTHIKRARELFQPTSDGCWLKKGGFDTAMEFYMDFFRREIIEAMDGVRDAFKHISGMAVIELFNYTATSL